MKVVLFCGGLGTRLREHSDTIPKPLVNIGYRPVIWHLMRYYSHFGHNDFVLALGYRGDMIRQYFLDYNEAMTNDFVLSEGGRKVTLMSNDTENWRITFVDTGLHSNIGQRLLRVRKYLGDDEMFLANYSDGVSNIPLDRLIDDFSKKAAVVSFASVRMSQTFHAVQSEESGTVTGMVSLNESQTWINGGFFALRPSIFDYLREGDELVEEPFQRLMERRLLTTYRHHGFWHAMDTLKDKIALDRLEAQGSCPWKVWLNDSN